MVKKAVIGIYDSLTKAEEAELLLGDVHLPMGQVSLIAPRMEAGEVHGDITAREVAETVATSGVQLSKEQAAEYEQALKEGKPLLVFYGDEKMVAKAYRALKNSEDVELTVLGS
jgi:hypothetical protein